MNKTPSYCYVRRKDLKKRVIRIFYRYSSYRQIPEERIEVLKTGDIDKDSESLLKLVKDESFNFQKAKLMRDDEVIRNNAHTQALATIEKYFICIQ